MIYGGNGERLPAKEVGHRMNREKMNAGRAGPIRGSVWSLDDNRYRNSGFICFFLRKFSYRRRSHSCDA